MKRKHAITLVKQMTRVFSDGSKPIHKGKVFIKQVLVARATRAEERLADRTANIAYTRTERLIWVRIADMRSTQGVLYPSRLAYQIRRYPIKSKPYVIAVGHGVYLLWDGNHRVTAALMLGRTRIKCVELRRLRGRLYAGAK